MNGIEGSRIVVSGGASEISRAFIARLAGSGATILLTDVLDKSAGTALAESFTGEVRYQRCDVSQPDDCDAVIAHAADIWGGLDTVYIHAGISDNAPFWELSTASWTRIVDVNLNGSFFLARAAFREMVKNPMDSDGHRGSMIFTSSFVADRPWGGSSNYCASKAGVNSLIRSIAQEAGPHGVTAVGVAPGFVDAGETRRHYHENPAFKAQVDSAIPLGHLVSAEDLAGLYCFLASREARYLSGLTIRIDGGAGAGGKWVWDAE